MTERSIEANTGETPLATPSPFVSPQWVQTHLSSPHLRLLDVRDRASYTAGHIPGAVQVELAGLSGIQDGVPGMLLPPAEYAVQMQTLGVSNQMTVVAYDSNWGMPAARVTWGLARYGHTNVAILNGGWDSWKEQDRPIEASPTHVDPGDFNPAPKPQTIAEYDWLQERLNTPDIVIVDTRTPGEHAQGHLPGSICWDWMNGVPPGGWEAIRPADELRAELEGIGVTPDKEVVTYCRSGARAAHTFWLLRSLGYQNVRNYDGSWLEWSHRLASSR